MTTAGGTGYEILCNCEDHVPIKWIHLIGKDLPEFKGGACPKKSSNFFGTCSKKLKVCRPGLASGGHKGNIRAARGARNQREHVLEMQFGLFDRDMVLCFEFALFPHGHTFSREHAGRAERAVKFVKLM